jgi:hypothetical protein
VRSPLRLHMSRLLQLQIAGVRFHIHCDEAQVSTDLGLYLQPFSESSSSGPASPDVEVRLVLQGMPDVTHLPQIFEAGHLWSAYQQSDERFLSVNYPLCQGRPSRLAQLDRNVHAVTVYSNETVVNRAGRRVGVSNPVRDPLDYLLVMYALAGAGGLLMHAAGVGTDGRGVVFAGESGAGKTTLCRQLAQHGGFELLSDDRIAVRKMDGRFLAFGTPWPGAAGIVRNSSVSLGRIVFLSHGDRNSLRDLTKQEALERLLPVASVPWFDRQVVPVALLFCDDLLSHVPACELQFTPDSRVISLVQDLLRR